MSMRQRMMMTSDWGSRGGINVVIVKLVAFLFCQVVSWVFIKFKNS